MANNVNKPEQNGNEMKDLLRMLDQIENRSLDEDIEEAILHYGYGEDKPQEAILQEKGFVPDMVQGDLSELLITPGIPTEDEEAEAEHQAAFLLESIDEESMTEDLPPPPEERRSPLAVLGDFFAANFPRKGDEPLLILRKSGFWLSLLVLLVALVYLISDLCVQPQMNVQLNNELRDLYRPEQSEVITNNPDYPENTLLSFEELYARNPEVSGWLSYHSYGNKDFINVELPVMYSGDNKKYVHRDYDGNKNKNGTLFLDGRNEITGPYGMDQSMIIYGHNMASGQMFAGLNKLIGSENNARLATNFTFSSLFRKDEYVVFAVALSEEAELDTPTYFNYWRTAFADGKEFMSFIQQVRDRSLFDYPTDVREDDSILILATCTGKTSAHLNDGRVLVFARRCRQGEGSIKTNAIVKNTDVIMPYNWYINQKLEPHEYYTNPPAVEDTPVGGGTTTMDTPFGDPFATDTTGDNTTSGTNITGNVPGVTGVVTPGGSTTTHNGQTSANPSAGTTAGTTAGGGESTTTGTTTVAGGDTTTAVTGEDATTTESTSAEDTTTSAEDTTTSAEDTTTSAEDTTTAAEDTTTAAEDTTTSAEETTTTAAAAE